MMHPSWRSWLRRIPTQLDSFKNKKDLKLKDYTSLDPHAKCYILVFNKEKGQEMIKVELDESPF